MMTGNNLFIDILALISLPRTFSLEGIAAEVGIPVELAKQLIRDLTDMDYLTPVGASSSACSGCRRFYSTNRNVSRKWKLSAKGRKCLENQDNRWRPDFFDPNL
jgi:hypothetical protein